MSSRASLSMSRRGSAPRRSSHLDTFVYKQGTQQQNMPKTKKNEDTTGCCGGKKKKKPQQDQDADSAYNKAPEQPKTNEQVPQTAPAAEPKKDEQIPEAERKRSTHVSEVDEEVVQVEVAAPLSAEGLSLSHGSGGEASAKRQDQLRDSLTTDREAQLAGGQRVSGGTGPRGSRGRGTDSRSSGGLQSAKRSGSDVDDSTIKSTIRTRTSYQPSTGSKTYQRTSETTGVDGRGGSKSLGRASDPTDAGYSTIKTKSSFTQNETDDGLESDPAKRTSNQRTSDSASKQVSSARNQSGQTSSRPFSKSSPRRRGTGEGSEGDMSTNRNRSNSISSSFDRDRFWDLSTNIHRKGPIPVKFRRPSQVDGGGGQQNWEPVNMKRNQALAYLDQPPIYTKGPSNSFQTTGDSFQTNWRDGFSSQPKSSLYHENPASSRSLRDRRASIEWLIKNPIPPNIECPKIVAVPQ